MTAPPCAKQAPGESKTNNRIFLKNKPRCKRICYLSVCLSEVCSQCSLLCLQFHECLSRRCCWCCWCCWSEFLVSIPTSMMRSFFSIRVSFSHVLLHFPAPSLRQTVDITVVVPEHYQSVDSQWRRGNFDSIAR
jgi:hypothetical protein